MRLVVRSFLIFFLLLPVFAAKNELYITVGTFKTKSRAEAQLLVLQKAMEKKPSIVRLRKANGFTYSVQSGGSYNLVVIEPFNDQGVLQEMLDASREVFPDAYARRYKSPKTTKVAKPVVVKTPAPVEVIEADVVKEVAAEALPVEEEAVEEMADSMPIVPYIEETITRTETIEEAAEPESPIITDDEVRTLEVVTFEAPKEAPVPEPLSAPTERSAGDNMMFYAILAALIAAGLLFIMILLGRKKKKKIEPFIFEEKVISPIDVDTPLGKDEQAVGKTVTSSTPISKERLPEVPDLAVPTSTELKSPIPPEAPVKKATETIASPRKKRESDPQRKKMRKDDLAEFSGNKVLVAEDNLINQKVITSLLAGSGIEIVIANNGQEALDMLEKNSDFQMILMDAHMPVKDGYQASQDIRDEPKYDHIPIVALSGDTSVDDIKRMRKAGMEEQLAKPLRIDALYDVMYCYFDIDAKVDESDGETGDTDSLQASKGLDISGGDKELYNEILTEFVETYGESDHVLDGYFVHDDAESAKALLLDIRGIAANIGAEQLSETAEELREALLDHTEIKYNALFEKYREQLYFLLSDIKQYR